MRYWLPTTEECSVEKLELSCLCTDLKEDRAPCVHLVTHHYTEKGMLFINNN